MRFLSKIKIKKIKTIHSCTLNQTKITTKQKEKKRERENKKKKEKKLNS